ncbi:unnamed protein product [Euphydryas editha]|uniref:Uncharacterized protein n=1 Tax=Euphydryas editha TaxID=104508 RepID=A0AAU9TSF5_EUPED|nr:unnamed protein product [Euphydryas editha]
MFFKMFFKARERLSFSYRSLMIMNLRRMKARRGQPAQIWSDSGTNLRGADNELRQAMDRATSSPSSLGQQAAWGAYVSAVAGAYRARLLR